MEYIKGNWEQLKTYLIQLKPKTGYHRNFKTEIVHDLASNDSVCYVFGKSKSDAYDKAKLIRYAPEMYDTLLKIAKYKNTEAGQLAIKFLNNK